ncbi:MAG: CapA family protein [Clostridium sp.]|nr:CapA family protein [Clostridium sp.]
MIIGSSSRNGRTVIDIIMSGNKILKKTVIKIGIILMMIVSIGTVFLFLWKDGFFLPRWIVWKNEDISAQTGKYEILLERKEVRILQGDALVWTSPENLKVQSVISVDIDNDKEEELILLCWKIGRYGEHRPFWVEKDERKWSQHIFVYEYQEDNIKPKWMSSYIGQDVAEICAEEKETGGFRLWLTEPDGQSNSFIWDFWGFVKEDTDVSIVVFGDNLIHEQIYRYGLQESGTFDFLFENIREQIEQSDISVINQETPLTDNPAMYSDYPRFGTPIQAGEAIADAGFDVVTCATNHALDKGAEGIRTTKEFFEEHDIICLGIQSADEKEEKPYEIVTRNGIRFALFNYTYGTNGIRIPEENPNMVHLLENEDKIREAVTKAGEEADFVIVFAHWGTEYMENADEFQQKWAKVFLECKVDVVVGTHPHTLQPYTILTDESGHEMLIFYSIGNFISAQKEETCVKGGMAAFTVSRTPKGCQVTDYTLQPLTITRQKDGGYTAYFPD